MAKFINVSRSDGLPDFVVSGIQIPRKENTRQAKENKPDITTYGKVKFADFVGEMVNHGKGTYEHPKTKTIWFKEGEYLVRADDEEFIAAHEVVAKKSKKPPFLFKGPKAPEEVAPQGKSGPNVQKPGGETVPPRKPVKNKPPKPNYKKAQYNHTVLPLASTMISYLIVDKKMSPKEVRDIDANTLNSILRNAPREINNPSIIKSFVKYVNKAGNPIRFDDLDISTINDFEFTEDDTDSEKKTSPPELMGGLDLINDSEKKTSPPELVGLDLIEEEPNRGRRKTSPPELMGGLDLINDLDKCNLSNRTFNVLKKAGYNTLDELSGIEESELYKLPGWGMKPSAELDECLHNYGLSGLKRREASLSPDAIIAYAKKNKHKTHTTFKAVEKDVSKFYKKKGKNPKKAKEIAGAVAGMIKRHGEGKGPMPGQKGRKGELEDPNIRVACEAVIQAFEECPWSTLVQVVKGGLDAGADCDEIMDAVHKVSGDVRVPDAVIEKLCTDCEGQECNDIIDQYVEDDEDYCIYEVMDKYIGKQREAQTNEEEFYCPQTECHNCGRRFTNEEIHNVIKKCPECGTSTGHCYVSFDVPKQDDPKLTKEAQFGLGLGRGLGPGLGIGKLTGVCPSCIKAIETDAQRLCPMCGVALSDADILNDDNPSLPAKLTSTVEEVEPEEDTEEEEFEDLDSAIKSLFDKADNEPEESDDDKDEISDLYTNEKGSKSKRDKSSDEEDEEEED